MKKTTEVKSKNKTRLNTGFLVMAVLLLVQFGTINLHAGGNTNNSPPPTPPDNDIRSFVCIVNRHIHPNMERYLNTLIDGFMKMGDEDSDEYAQILEYEKRGGFGSGFIYVDSNGNNYIITNYHVIIGAYRLSVTFEDEKGERTVYKNLSVFSVDEQEDLAILAFPDGQRPFRRGIPISSTQLRSGSAVAAAGYPGISYVPTWNLYFGNAGNPRVIPPGYEYAFIQHNADINPGNSGGPLLIEDTLSPVGYSVVGVNTMQIQALQGANYAIPAERVNAFLQRSFQQTDERVSLENRIRQFIELLERSTTNDIVFRELSSYLSSTMINANPERTVFDLPDDAEMITDEILDDPVIGIAWAVAFTQIENPIYVKSRSALAQKGLPEVISVEPNNMGGYTASLLINGYPYRTEWIREYGTWKLDEFIQDAGEYNDYPDLATVHPMGKKVIYSLSSVRDYDWFTLNIPRAGRLTVRTEGNIDPMLDIMYDPSIPANRERPIAYNDDYSGRGLNAQVSADVRAGTVYVRVRLAGGSPGEYILLAGFDGEIDNIPYTSATTTTTTTTYNGPQITVTNNTGNSVWFVYIRETASNTWGDDRLSSDQILNNGESVSLQLQRPINQANRYDIRLVTLSGDYIKTNIQVSANARIVFTSADRQ